MFLVILIFLGILYPEMMGITFWILVVFLVMTINGIDDALAAPALALASDGEAGSSFGFTVKNFFTFFI